MTGSTRKHPLVKTESFHCSSGCIPIRNVLKLRVNKRKRAIDQLDESIFKAIESLRNWGYKWESASYHEKIKRRINYFIRQRKTFK